MFRIEKILLSFRLSKSRLKKVWIKLGIGAFFSLDHGKIVPFQEWFYVSKNQLRKKSSSFYFCFFPFMCMCVFLWKKWKLYFISFGKTSFCYIWSPMICGDVSVPAEPHRLINLVTWQVGIVQATDTRA